MAGTGKLERQLRDLCLSLPETTETDAWGHPNFRAGKKTFAVFEHHQGRPLLAFRLTPPDREARLLDPAFFDPPYSQGKWVALWADTPIARPLLVDLVMCSYRAVALKRMLKALEGQC